MKSLYSKEIMKHFKNPKNVGVIKNADGKGRVGNLACLPIGSEIQSNPHLYSIEKLKVGSFVLSHDGKYSKVSKVFKRNYSGKIINIKSRLGIVKLTPDHIVKSIKVPIGDEYLRIKNKCRLPAAWYHAIELKKNDILLYPKPKIIKDVKKIKIDVPKYKYDFRSKEIPKTIAVNGDFLRLAGYFIAEGNTNTKMCHVNLTLSFGSHEKEYINDASNLFKKIFNLNPIIRTDKQRNVTTLIVNNVHVTQFFNKLFGKGCANKQIPEFMLFLPTKKQKELIKGLWRGDGFINTKIPCFGFSTASYKLAQQMKFLLIRQGIIPSIYIEKEKNIKGTQHRQAYRIRVGSWSALKLAKILNVKLCKKELTHDSWANQDYIYFPITSVSNEFYDGEVYNLEIENTHSFATDSALLHNCGDIMELYIKVKKDKNGKERISDVKFQTFGCIVALAVSSILTTIVKGKTLEQAIKISNNDILKKSGPVPPIKIHCSILAADALHEAIYDYLTKNKRVIPESLQKEHERIKKTLEQVEKTHKDFTKFEEKMLKK
ncbi:MAG: iron-sulfur cluster assembly scaffold protein [Candidatus Aenigmatarchaeota archaeon]